MFEIISLKPSLIRGKFNPGPKLKIDSHCEALALVGLLGIKVVPNEVKRVDLNEARRRLIFAVNTWESRKSRFACCYEVDDRPESNGARETHTELVTVDELSDLLDRYETFLDEVTEFGASFIVMP